VGDYVLENDQLRAVFDAIESPHHLAPSGGTLIDLSTRTGGDHLNQIYQVTGILPRDTVRYERADLVVDPDRVALVVRGHLDGDTRVEVVTTYELRPCDQGIRMRTELYNGGRTVWASFLADGYFWGDRSMTPFTPARGQGYRREPALNLLDLDATWSRVPWFAASAHAAPHVSYATVGCARALIEGIHDPTISAVGIPRAQVQPGDGLVFERIVVVGDGPGFGAAEVRAARAHSRMHASEYAWVRGRTVYPGGSPIGGDERRASLMFYEPGEGGTDDAAAIVPWADIVAEPDGTFVVALPAQRTYRVQAYRLGRAVGTPRTFSVGAANAETPVLDLGNIAVPVAAQLSVQISEASSLQPLIGEIVVIPSGTTRPTDVQGTTHGYFEACAPYLGPPDGASPACNRAIVRGSIDGIAIAPGTYDVYATAGPRYSLSRQTVTLAEGTGSSIRFSLRAIPNLDPPGSVDGDFHVHGGRSFDSAFPDDDRVMSFIASGVDVIIATDHDACSSYRESVDRLGVGDRVIVIPGVEMTPLIPYFQRPGSSVPRVIGHFNFWPIPYDITQPRNGAPWDELMQPGELFDRMRPMVGAAGVIQLNHPTASSKVGRDEGYLRAIRYDPRVALPGRDDGTGAGMLYRRPGGPSGHTNLDFDTQEVLNGAGVVHNLQYRDVWHQFLNQGLIRAGTANSDSHSLNTEVLGYPRNVVLGSFDLPRLDHDAFNRAVREGHMVGTNGPFIDARITGTGGLSLIPGVAVQPLPAGARLEIVVRAAPWIPVTEIRVIVNGRVARTIARADIRFPTVPIDSIDGVERWTGGFMLSDLLMGRDGWIVVEAGVPLPASRDLRCDADDPMHTDMADGLIDCVDGNGDGLVNETAMVRGAQDDPRYLIDLVAPGTLPMAFTNPFVLDVDGNGWTPPGVTR